jgi:4,5-dihydroxyphthalate decarboxylase
MHLVGVRRELLAQDPALTRKVYDAFNQAKDAVPPEQSDTLNENIWLYGVARNKAALESLAGYAFEQGLTNRRLRLDELFAPELLET